MTTIFRATPRDLREQVVGGTVGETADERDRDGWDQPHLLAFVNVHRMDDEHVAATVEPFPVPLDGLPGEEPWQRLQHLAVTLSAFTELTKEVPPLPDGCAGLLFLAESWMAEVDPEDEAHVMPSQNPARKECLIGSFVDFAGNLASAVRVRDTPGIRYFDLADLSESDREKTLAHSRIYPSLLVIGLLLGAHAHG